MDRWATFDCYGTLVDWNTGIRTGIEAVFGAQHENELFTRYHELEPAVQAECPGCSYREVLTLTLERLAEEQDLQLPEGEGSTLARALPGWPVFDDARPALEEARARGWRLAILSNTDRDLIDASMRAIGVSFELAIVASEIGSYKPSHRHWEVFRERTGVGPDRHVHVAQSLFHDIAPAAELGIRSIWINRLGEPRDPRPAAILTGLAGLAGELDRLVPAGA